MKSAALLVVVAACGFEGTPAGGAATIDAATIDAQPLDAPTCPAAPDGCTAFACAETTSCYYLCTAKLRYGDAQARCQSASIGCMTRVDSAAEDQCLHDFAMPDFFAGTIVFVGFRQAADQPATDAGWSWQCGDTQYLASNWGTFEPNDNDLTFPFMEMNRENCTAITGGGAWLDVSCDDERRYICELER